MLRPRRHQYPSIGWIDELLHRELVRHPDWVLEIHILSLQPLIHLFPIVSSFLQICYMVDFNTTIERYRSRLQARPMLNFSKQQQRVGQSTCQATRGAGSRLSIKDNAPNAIASPDYAREYWHRCRMIDFEQLCSPLHHATLLGDRADSKTRNID